MCFDGVYPSSEATSPEKVRATGSQDEWDTLSAPVSLPTPPTPVYDRVFDPFTGWTNAKKPSGKHIVDLPPDRDLINDIARHVEVECDDQRLINWMSGEE